MQISSEKIWLVGLLFLNQMFAIQSQSQQSFTALLFNLILSFRKVLNWMSSVFEVRQQNSLTGHDRHLTWKIEEKANDDTGLLFYFLFILWHELQKLA
jgi:hypothetical protein